jgi:hypothetical protein
MRESHPSAMLAGIKATHSQTKRQACQVHIAEA